MVLRNSFLLFFFSLVFSLNQLSAATVDTVQTYSKVMARTIKAVVIKPKGYSKERKYPNVYLLHGYSGSFSDWIKKDQSLKQLADRYQVLIICPDGNYSSWYFDSPVDKASQYETYVTSELISWVEAHYSCLGTRAGRVITGLSMGGHGALYLAFRHQNLYGAAGSMSGVVDLRPFSKEYDISKRLGDIGAFPDRWKKNSVVSLTTLLKPGSLQLIFDCGTEDPFSQVNAALHEKLMELHIPHEYISRPGKHEWPYWANSIEYQMLFFHHFFKHP